MAPGTRGALRGLDVPEQGSKGSSGIQGGSEGPGYGQRRGSVSSGAQGTALLVHPLPWFQLVLALLSQVAQRQDSCQ